MRTEGRLERGRLTVVTTVAIEQEVLVIGGGLAGVTAALTATRAGARTRLLSHKQSTLRQASGLVDVLGYTSDGEGPLVDPFDALSALHSSHPYERVGQEALEAGLALFDDVTDDQYRGEHTPTNALLPTCGGSIKPTARYPAGMAAGLASDERDILLVGFERLPGLDAPLAAEQLEQTGLPANVRGVTIEFPVEVSPEAKVTRFAHLLDQNSGPRIDNVRRALAERVATQLAGEKRVGFPAVLGLESHREVCAELEGILSVDVFEVPTGPPSLPGIRLENRLYRALDEVGVLVETGNPVVGYESQRRASEGPRSVDTVLVDRNGSQVPYEAEQYVLATGGLVGQGIDSDRSGVREPIFDCHVPHPPDRYAWFEDDAFGDHAFAQFGLAVDADLRVLDSDGKPTFENLRAAGAILGNYDYAAEKSASGVSLATGYRAGTRAGESV